MARTFILTYGLFLMIMLSEYPQEQKLTMYGTRVLGFHLKKTAVCIVSGFSVYKAG